MTILAELSDYLVTSASPSVRPLAALGQAGGAESGGISGVALWVGLLALLVIFLAIIMKAFGQRRSGFKQLDTDRPETDLEADVGEEDEEPGDRKPSLKEIKEARAQKLGGALADKEAVIKARQARKGASRAVIEEVESEVRDDPDEPTPDVVEVAAQPTEPATTPEAERAAPEKKPEPARKTEPEKAEPAKKTEPAKKAEPEKKPEPPAAQKTLRDGLAKTRSGFFGRLRGLFAKEKAIDDALMGELEEVLLTADIGVKTSMKLLSAVEAKVAENGEVSAAQVWDFLRAETAQILQSTERRLVIGEERPFVILIIGVNGVGKTTTIGKLASRFKGEGHQVLLIAGDTFRAAAIDQLKIWGGRAGCEVFAGDEGADPSGVVFDGLKRAEEVGADVVLVDTAGRLHTKVNLVEELKKVHRVCSKAIDGAPHETLLVLDANTGQNAINQADMFGKEVGVSGIALTKLDGTAKGGVVIGISDELGVPVQFVGIGEQVEDLREFHADEFVDAVF